MGVNTRSHSNKRRMRQLQMSRSKLTCMCAGGATRLTMCRMPGWCGAPVWTNLEVLPWYITTNQARRSWCLFAALTWRLIGWRPQRLYRARQRYS